MMHCGEELREVKGPGGDFFYCEPYGRVWTETTKYPNRWPLDGRDRK